MCRRESHLHSSARPCKVACEWHFPEVENAHATARIARRVSDPQLSARPTRDEGGEHFRILWSEAGEVYIQAGRWGLPTGEFD